MALITAKMLDIQVEEKFVDLEKEWVIIMQELSFLHFIFFAVNLKNKAHTAGSLSYLLRFPILIFVSCHIFALETLTEREYLEKDKSTH